MSAFRELLQERRKDLKSFQQSLLIAVFSFFLTVGALTFVVLAVGLDDKVAVATVFAAFSATSLFLSGLVYCSYRLRKHTFLAVVQLVARADPAVSAFEDGTEGQELERVGEDGQALTPPPPFERSNGFFSHARDSLQQLVTSLA